MYDIPEGLQMNFELFAARKCALITRYALDKHVRHSHAHYPIVRILLEEAVSLF